MEVFIKASQFVASLSLLIILHELGHFIPAKLFKTKVEKFYLFFDPYFSLFKKKYKGTEFGIGWLPLGGYVKISGMVDESMDTEYQNQPVQPWEFRAKPAWQRLIIMLGGVIVNILVAAIIYAGIYTYWGEKYLPTENAIHGISFSKEAQAIGFQNGDKIISIGGERIAQFYELQNKVLISNAPIYISRNGQPITIQLTGKEKKSLLTKEKSFITPRIPFVIQDFTANSKAAEAGLLPNDRIISVNGIPAQYIDEIVPLLETMKGQEVEIAAIREGYTVRLQTPIDSEEKLGVIMDLNLASHFTLFETDYHIFEAVGVGFKRMVSTLTNYVQSLKLLFQPETEAYKSLGGFISIGKRFSPTWDWYSFWQFTAFFSVMLAVLNILPIPALDGGHVLFLLIELFTRKKVPEKVLGYAQTVGFLLVIGLFLFANVNDLVKLFT